MRKVLIVVVIIAVAFLSLERNQARAYSIISADTVVSVYINNPTPTPTALPTAVPTPTSTPSATITPGPSPTPGPEVSPTPTPVLSPTPKPGEGAERFSLYGYTSPKAIVSVTNPGMYIDTTADNTGYFVFHNFFTRVIIEDICLTAQDQAGRVTMPVCIPPIPSQDNQSVGPVLMPPTISLNNDSFYSGDTVVVSGQTTPRSDVQLSLFTDESKSGLAGLNKTGISPGKRALLAMKYLLDRANPVQTSYAATKPKQTAKVDGNGNFTVILPSSDPLYFRTFAQTILRNDYSLKSVTLNFNIFPGWFLVIKWLLGFFDSLKGRIPEIIILTQVVIIVYLVLRHYLQPHVIARMRSLAIVEHPLPVLLEHTLLLEEHELILHHLEEERKALEGQI